MTPLSPFAAEWPAISALLDEALSLPASERTTWLDGLSGERAVHREALRTLLAHRPGAETDDFLRELPKLEISDELPGNALTEGSLVGAYRLIAEIGRGGMGTVWLAERSDGTVRRRVAMKLPRVVWGDAFAERLAREREILATLEHEHIARLYDAGVDEHRRPFLAMEYVEGASIDAYCRANASGVRVRIALLQQVMAAVAHAHARLVVHRDLKPNNILVTKDAQAKLLDFGIAKLLEGDRTRETALTELGGRALTLDYASPEQIRGEPLGTASDIYSMAVVAYEVLTGVRPYRLKRDSAAELEEAISTVEPPLASGRVSDGRVARQLRGDLDSILNKALKKVASERYSTMDAFAHDLQRYLDGEPVEARPDGLAYRAAKFVGRHRLQVAAGVVVAVALVAGTSVALWQAREARIEAATAKAVQGFIESVFKANSGNQADPKAGRAITARELLDRGAERIDKELASAPEAQLRLYGLLADMYAEMWLNERSLELMRRGLTLATRLHGANSEAALSTATSIGQLLDDVGQSEEALAMLLRTDAVARSRRDDRDAIRMRIDTNLAQIYYSTDLAKGLERSRNAAAIARVQGPSLEGISALHVLGEVAKKSGRLEEAREAFTDAVAWIDRQPQGSAGALPLILGAVGEVQDRLGQPEAAGATLNRAIAVADRLGDTHSRHSVDIKLALYLYDNGLLHEALETTGANYVWARSLGAKHDFGTLPGSVTLQHGRTLIAYGDVSLGLAVLDEGRALLPSEESFLMARYWGARAEALISLQRLAEAGADIDRAMSLATNGDERLLESLRSIRRRYWVAAGKVEEALQDASASPPKDGTPATPYTDLRRRAERATLLLAAGRPTDAMAAATDALAAIDRLPARRFARDVEAQMTAVLGQAMLREDRISEALQVLQEALTLHLAEYDPVHSPATAKVRVALDEAKRRAAR